MERSPRRLQGRLEGGAKPATLHFGGKGQGLRQLLIVIVQLDRRGETRLNRLASHASRAEGVHEVRVADTGCQRRGRRPHRNGERADGWRW